MSWTLAELAEMCGGVVKGDPSRRISGFASADEAGEGELTFVASPAWLAKLGAGAAAVIPPSLEKAAGNIHGIVVDDPRLAFALILNKIVKAAKSPAGVHSTAVVAPDAVVDGSASVGAAAYVGARAVIQKNAVIYPQAYIGDDVEIGAETVIYPHCYVGAGCRIGYRVTLGPGTSIGFDGFGYRWDGAKHAKIPQVGIVVIEDDVEMGAMCAVDRATLGETRIGAGTKMDNFVMVGHNCRVGKNVILVSQVGLAGRAVIEDGVIIAGQAGVRDGVRVGKGAIVAGQSGVAKDVPPGKRVGGTPARSEIAWLRNQAMTEKIPELKRRISDLEKRIEELEKKR